MFGRAPKQNNNPRHYEILGVDRNVGTDELKKACKKDAIKNYPDKGGEAEKVSTSSMKTPSSRLKDGKGGKKSPSPANGCNAGPAGSCSSVSGNLQSLDPLFVSTLSTNGRSRNTDETDDSVSNNGSWSGESEDHKEKPTASSTRQDGLPGPDNEKREKNRQKNERKHQRQKERRAQELHDRCNGYLMSRKLEVLALQLVSMGFSHERATMALILNEGKVEDSVSWLFEEGDDADKHLSKNLGNSGLKIDVSEELARVADLEARFKCTKQEVERAVVASEGDLDKAEENLRASKPEPSPAPPKAEENCVPSSSNPPPLLQPRPVPPHLQQGHDDKDFNYTKIALPDGSTLDFAGKNAQPCLRKTAHRPDWVKPQNNNPTSVDKGWPSVSSNANTALSVVSIPVASSPAVVEARFATPAGEQKGPQPVMREPFTVMQRPQPVNQQPFSATSSSLTASTAGCFGASDVDVVKSGGFVSPAHGPRFLNTHRLVQDQMPQVPCHPNHFSLGTRNQNPQRVHHGSWSRSTGTPTLAAASSLGLFSSTASAALPGASSVDWGTAGSVDKLDYTSIDWSLDRGFLMPRRNGLLLEHPSLKNATHFHDTSNLHPGSKPCLPFSAPVRREGGAFPRSQNGVINRESSAGVHREWTSPFEGRDLFSLPRQLVSFPSL